MNNSHIKIKNNFTRSIFWSLCLAFSLLSQTSEGVTQRQEAWATSWMASQQSAEGPESPMDTQVPKQLDNQTVRQFFQLSVGGESIRVHLSNVYGNAPLKIDQISVAHPGKNAGSIRGASNTVTFGGKTNVSIPTGASVVSDPVNFGVDHNSSVAITFYVSEVMPIQTYHWDGQQTAYIGKGNQLSNNSILDAKEITSRILVSAIQVPETNEFKTVVAIGDSMTDGSNSGVNTNSRWTDFLAVKLSAKGVAVLNAGLTGGRMLSGNIGPSVLSRLERDVLSQPDIDTLVVLVGINDISFPGQAFAINDPVLKAEDIYFGYKQIVERCRTRGIRIVAATLPPFEGAFSGTPLDGYYTNARNLMRLSVNKWIRTSGAFDAVVDLDQLLRDSKEPNRLNKKFDSGDHLHANALGNRAIAYSMTLEILFGEK